MASSDYERRTSQDYIDQHTDRHGQYDANSWGLIVGIVAVVGIIAMLFIGFNGSGPADRTKQPAPAIERTAPAPSAPTTQPVTVPK